MDTVKNPRQPMPRIVWIAIVSLAAMGIIQLVVAMDHNALPLALAGTASLAIVPGLRFGQRWAYTLVVGISALTLLFLLLAGDVRGAIISTAFNALVFVPVIMATRWFWRQRVRDDSDFGTFGGGATA